MRPGPGQEWIRAAGADYGRPVEELQEVNLSGEVYYGEEAGITIPACKVGDRFKEIKASLRPRRPPGTAPSDSECRFYPISSQYCPGRREE